MSRQMNKRKRSESVFNSSEYEFEELIKTEIPDNSQYCISNINKEQRCDSSKLSKGSLVYRPARIEICSKNGNMFEIKNQETNEVWNLNSKLIETQCYSPDQYTKIEKITKTEMALKLKEEVGDCVCKVEFYKLPDANEMSNLIKEGSNLIEKSEMSEKQKLQAYKKLFERTQKGEYRIMRGYIARSTDQQALESETGMLKFIDAESISKGLISIRQINLMNIQSLTYKLVRYELK